MPDITITDTLDQPIEKINVDLKHPSSLLKYLTTEALHFAVFPDFLARKDKTLSQAATKPIAFEGKVQHKVQLGNGQPQISLRPEVEARIRVNASPETSLFDNDPFQVPAMVPENTGYVSVGFGGSIDVGAAASLDDLTFGFDKKTGLNLEYFKAFPLGSGEPSLGEALGTTISSYVIPSNLADFRLLGENDIATVSGHGSLKLSSTVTVAAFPNPLASVDLPLTTASLSVTAGPAAGFSATFVISGSYQIRVRRQDTETFELSISPERGTAFNADFSASDGVTAGVGQTDLIAALIGMISRNPLKDQQALTGLQPAEREALTAAIKAALDHSVSASVDLILAAASADQCAFQYEIQPDKLGPPAREALNKAVHGDLSLLTGMEHAAGQDGVLAPGLKMLNSVLSETRKRSAALKVNLLGIFNYSTLSELVRNSEMLTDDVTGDITIKETVTGTRISSITDPLARAKAMRKAMFDSVLITTTYRAGNAVSPPQLSCEQVHYAMARNTGKQNIQEYLNWFVALNLLTSEEQQKLVAYFAGGDGSTCVLRTAFGDAECNSLFFDQSGTVRSKSYYLDIGRRAMRALLNPQENPNDQFRYRLLSDSIWPQAVKVGASYELASLVGLGPDDPRAVYLTGDVDVITSWADAMVDAGALVADVRKFVGDADPAALAQNSDFKKKRDALQKRLSAMVKASKVRFDEPWGMVCLFWAAGSSPRNAYGKAVAQGLVIERGMEKLAAASADSLPASFGS